MSNWKLQLVSRRINNGEYVVNDRYLVIRRKAAGMYEGGVSWYWQDGQSDAKSGYFSTKTEAMSDLDHHVNVASGREAFAKSKGWA